MEQALLAWYSEHGRDLPWRRTRDPYAVLVSEVMAQQTQIARVVPRWEEWTARWPTVESLAAAPLADVIRAWQGLGYNRRAVALHRAARVVAEHGWPDDLTELPGVGRYTADAVSAFAFGRPVLPVDVNVRRVAERTGASFSPAPRARRSWTSARPCVSPACPGAGPARWPPSVPRAAAATSRTRKQGPLEGSFRQRRARALRLVASGEAEIADREALESLERDGLVQVTARGAALPA